MRAASNSSKRAGSAARPSSRSKDPRTTSRVLVSPSLSRCSHPIDLLVMRTVRCVTRLGSGRCACRTLTYSIRSFRNSRDRPQDHPFATMHPARFFLTPLMIVAAEMQNAVDQQHQAAPHQGSSTLFGLAPAVGTAITTSPSRRTCGEEWQAQASRMAKASTSVVRSLPRYRRLRPRIR